MALMDFNIDTSGSPQDVQRKQALADALMKQGMDSTPAAGGPGGGWITALNRGLAGALGGYQRGTAANEEQQGRSGAQSRAQQLAVALGAGGKVSPGDMVSLAGDPWASPAQTQAITHVADMQAQQARQAVEDQHWKASYELQKQAAARAADKTPSGFMADPANPGAYIAIPGGPTDPAYLAKVTTEKAKAGSGIPQTLGKGGELYHIDNEGKVVVDHKNAENADASLDDETAGLMAKQYLAGDRSVMQNLGRGAQGSANIVKLRGAIKAEADRQGLDGNGIAQRMIDYVGDTSRERTAATQEGRMSPAGIEAHGAISLGRVASDAVPRGNWVPINKAIQAFQEGTSDPALRAFGSANTTIINTYARAINPNGVGTVADKEHARQMLSTADGPAAYKAVLDQLDKEIEMAHKSPALARTGFKQERDQRLNGVVPTEGLPTGATSSSAFKDGDIAHNPQTGEKIVRRNGKWEPMP